MDSPRNVESVSNLHNNQISNPSQDTGLVLNNGYKSRSSLNLFVPENVNIDRILEDNPPDFPYFRDCFVYILHLITKISSRDTDEISKNNGFTPISRKFLQRRIHEYKKYVEYLKERGIIIESRHYIVGEKSMGLKFHEDYNSEIKTEKISKKTLIKSILTKHQNKNEEMTLNLHFLNGVFNSKLSVDFIRARRYLRKTYIEEKRLGLPYAKERYNARLLPLIELKNEDYSFSVDNTGYRLHTNITRLSSKLRKFLRYDGKYLYSIDVVNSQPFLTIPLFNEELFNKNNISDKIINESLITKSNFPIMIVERIREIKDKPDVKLFIKYVSNGEFYEKFGEELIKRGLFEGDIKDEEIREKVKKIIFSTIYSPNTSLSYNSEMRVFYEVFPNVYEMFHLIKYGHGNHPAFSILLQRLESELILNKICERIHRAYPKIPLFTIHDSIVTTEEYVGVVKNFMVKIMRQNIGKSPKFKIKRWE